jgi:hypothetical protein
MRRIWNKMAMDMGMIYKLFLITFGVVGIFIVYLVFTSVTASSCYPDELYTHDETTGFKVGIFDNVYDSMCSSFADMNSGIWQFYKNSIVGISGGRTVVASFSDSIWNMGKVFCKTHTNYDYANIEGNDAINDPEVFLELFLYESERCWNIFEGKNSEQYAHSDRDPIANIGFFDCAEIIYNFGEGESLSIDRINERINEKNTCSEQSNTPDYDNIYWCAPKDIMREYWTDFFYNGNLYLEGSLTSKYYSAVSACVPYNEVNIPTYNGDQVSVIDGKGKITISYFDYFDWDNFWGTNKNEGYDNYPACYYLNAFNNFEEIGQFEFPEDNYKDFDKNTLVICFEKYDTEGYCDGKLDCEHLEYFGLNDDTSLCSISYSCEVNVQLFNTHCTEKTDDATCEGLEYSQCRRNEYAGCEWETSGRCVGDRTCSGCGVSAFDARSECDLSIVCKEQSLSCITTDNACSDLDYFNCLRAECAGCRWEK